MREQFPVELRELRRRAVYRGLIVMLDGDKLGPLKRKEQLDEACRQHGVEPRSAADRAAVLVPTWSIESWLAYLDGKTVDERRSDYPRLEKARSSKPHVAALLEMCHTGRLREPVPPSLRDACCEFRKRIEPERS